MQRMTIEEFHASLSSQGLPRDDLALVCPMCGTVQSARDLMAAGAGSTFEEVEKYLGFSCVGRFTGEGSPRKVRDGKPCNWTLGGLFSTHKLEVIDGEGRAHPRFVPATAVEAQACAAKRLEANVLEVAHG